MMYHYNISFPLALQDMSAYVKKVNFKLHDSYANANRTLTKPPYEVTETGWGEFEIVIKIYFQDPSERPVTIYHILKLFQTGEIILDHYTLYAIYISICILIFLIIVFSLIGNIFFQVSLQITTR